MKPTTTSLTSLATLICATPLMVSCVMFPAGPGSEPGKVPPRIVQRNGEPVWDNPSAFGPVPADLKATGNQICQSVDLERATGYHPDARGPDGKAFPGGGYFCEGKMDKKNN